MQIAADSVSPRQQHGHRQHPFDARLAELQRLHGERHPETALITSADVAYDAMSGRSSVDSDRRAAAQARLKAAEEARWKLSSPAMFEDLKADIRHSVTAQRRAALRAAAHARNANGSAAAGGHPSDGDNITAVHGAVMA